MKITDHVYEIELSRGKAFLIQDQQTILIDTGLPLQQNQLLQELEMLLGNHRKLDAILLTHHDVDHVGNLVALQEKYDVDAFIHPNDLPYALGHKHRPGAKHQQELEIQPKISHRLFPYPQNTFPLQDILTPGHTPGHMIFQYQNVIFVGDLFKVTDNKPVPSYPQYTLDNQQAAKDIQRLLTLHADWLCPSHGNSIPYDTQAKKALLEVMHIYQTREPSITPLS